MIVPETLVSYWSISKKNSHWFQHRRNINFGEGLGEMKKGIAI